MDSLNKPTSILFGDKPFISLLKKLSSQTLLALYEHSGPVVALFGQLPELSKHYIMRILFVEQSISKAVVASWTSAIDESKEAIDVLKELQIISESSVVGGLPGWILNENFRKSLKTALLGGGQPWPVHKKVLDRDKYYRGIEHLDQYSSERWGVILNYMTKYKLPNEAESQSEAKSSSAGGDELDKLKIDNETKEILINGELVNISDGDEVSITSKGFQFLLMDTYSQVWYFLHIYFTTAEKKMGTAAVELIVFLCQIGLLTLGKDYSTDDLTGNLPMFLQSLRVHGLVFQRKRKAGRFYPTRLATSLFCNPEALTTQENDQPGYIVVETNYRVYAYTTSQLQISLLAFFTELQYHFPNMILGVITRESIREALRNGITAEQIINFLKTNAHPEMRKSRPDHVIPPTVDDQIRLWEQERDRFTFREGMMYDQFQIATEFDVLRNYAKERGVLMYENAAARVIIVTNEGHDEVRKFWKRYKKE